MTFHQEKLRGKLKNQKIIYEKGSTRLSEQTKEVCE